MSSTSSVPAWLPLVGVVLGFVLGEGARYARYRWYVSRNKRIIKTELSTILSQVPQKKDILNQAIAHLKQKQFMPTLSVRIVTTGYRSVLNEVYPHLTLVERNCLHVIYERIRVADETMDGFEGSFAKTAEEKIIDDYWNVYIGRLDELLQSYSVVEALARKFLANKPVDVFAGPSPTDG